MKLIKYIAVSMLLAGCASAPPQKQIHPLPFFTGQVWSGSYICGQGATSLDLRIQNVSGSSYMTELGKAYDVSAVFDFDFNNRSAAGSFYLDGKFYPEKNVATFKPTEWIQRPSGYSTVGLDGLISNNGKTYSGKILHSSCKGFKVNLAE